MRKIYASFEPSGHFRGIINTMEDERHSYIIMLNLSLVEIDQSVREILEANPTGYHLDEDGLIARSTVIEPTFSEEAIADGETPFVIEGVPEGATIMVLRNNVIVGSITSLDGTASLVFSEPGDYIVSITHSGFYEVYKKEIHVV